MSFSTRSACLTIALVMSAALFGGTVAAAGAAGGGLSVTSDPSEATVYVDGRHVGQTPTTVAELAAGEHRVRVVKAGYLENSRVIKVGSGRTGAIEVRLTARPAQALSGVAGLRIVVVAGEGAVNIIQQKTAVAPVVEVLDRNDQPVAGALVKFSIQGGRATFNGARAMTLTTNAAGRAGAASLTPTASGPVQISASASFQGQVATATIVQTNFLTVAAATAAAATAAGVATAAGGATAGAAAGGATVGGAAVGGGLGVSATTLAIVGGAVVGGTVVTTKVVGGGGVKIYEGDFRMDAVSTTRDVRSDGSVSFSCTSTLSITAEARAEIEELGDGTVTGTVSANGYVAELARTCPFAGGTSEHLPFGSGNVTGTAASFQASGVNMSFSGALSGGVITGIYTLIPGTYVSPTLNADGSRREQVQPPTSAPVRLTN